MSENFTFKNKYPSFLFCSIVLVIWAMGGWCSSVQAQPPGCGGVSGLLAEYYAGYFNDNQRFFIDNAPVLTRTDPSLNYNTENSFGAIVPPATGSTNDPDQFSARFRGSLYIATAGTYTLFLGSDDASYLWLDNAAIAAPAATAEALINNGGSHAYQIRYVSVFLRAGWHNLLIHYGENRYGNRLTFEYQSTQLGIPRQIVPANALCTGSEKAIRYEPNTLSMIAGSTMSSPAPLLREGASPLTGIVLANAATLPAGITIDAGTGVVTVDATVPLGRYDLSVTLTNGQGSLTFENVLTVSVLTPPPPDCAGLDPGGRPATSGLYAEYFEGNFLDDQTFFITWVPRLIRTDANLDFNTNDSWGNIVPPAGGSQANPLYYSVRFRGSLHIETAGLYTFHLGSDDGSYLWIDNAALAAPAISQEALIQNGGAHTYLIRTASIYLTAGLHNVLVHYGQGTGQNRITLEYESAEAGVPRQIVPGNRFCTGLEKGIVYTPRQLKAVIGTLASTPTPILVAGSSPLTGIVLENAAELPPGITIDPTTGIVTADGTVPLGNYVLNVTMTNAAGSLTFRDVLTVTVLSSPPPDCGGIDPGGNPASSGLYTEFYSGYFADDQAFFANRAPRFARTVGRLDLNTTTWGAIIPPALGSPDNPDQYSARFRGSVFIAAAGNYTFHLGSDDAGYLWLDEAALTVSPSTAQALVANGGTHGYVVSTATVFLTAGMHPLLIHYGDSYGGNRLTLEYESAELGIFRQIVPNRILCTAEPISLTYNPRYLKTNQGRAASSNAPTIAGGSATIVGMSIANAAALPAGIRIANETGVISADAGVPPGSYNLNVTLTLSNGALIFNNVFTLVVLGPAPPGCNYVSPGGEVATSGISAEYFAGYFDDSQTFFLNQTPSLVRTDYQLNFNTSTWGAIIPPAGGSSTNPDFFSVRYQGSLYVATAGTYTFYLGSDDASYFWIDGAAADVPAQTSKALINNGGRHGYVIQSASVYLTAGLHDMLLHYGESASGNQLTLEYESVALGIPRQLVPNTALCAGVSFEPLPVDLLFFRATTRSESIELDWATASESNHAYFTVERSADAQHFEAILQREAQNGNATSAQHYHERDQQPLPGTNYYRLKMTDADGKVTYSKIISAEFVPGKPTLRLQPNPAIGVDISLLLEGDTGNAERELRVHNIHGVPVYQATFQGMDTRIPTHNWPAGLYIVTLRTGKHTFTQKVVVQ